MSGFFIFRLIPEPPLMFKSIWARFLVLIASWAIVVTTIWIIAILLIVITQAKTVVVINKLSATATVEQNPPVVSTSTISKKYISVNDVLPGLIQCESGGRDIKHLDSDGYYSYDVTQFHLLTFLNYGKQFGVLPTSTTEAQARVLIMQPALALQLTSDMLEAGLWKQWFNCATKLGIDDNTVIY